MRESCYCGRSGEISDREPVTLKDGVTGLACPSCGHTDRLEWLSGEARGLILEEAIRKHPKAA